MIEALRTVLMSDAEVTQHLDLFDFGDGASRPAVFCGDPDDKAANSCVILSERGGGSDEGNRAQRAGEYSFTVRTRWDKKTSPALRRDHAMMLWRKLNRYRLTVDDFDDMRLRVSLPSMVSDSDGFPGYTLDGTCVAEEAV